MITHEIELPLHQIADHVFDFNQLFPGYTKVAVEIGFCSGIFLSQFANRYPETAFLGIEKKLKFFERGENTLRRNLKQDNVRLVQFDAIPVFSELIPDESVDDIHVYFPDPWPKKKHNERRILCADNIMLMGRKLKKGGLLYAATDHPQYGEYIKKQIPKTTSLLKQLPYGRDDREILTKWEKKQIQAGWDIYYFLLQRI